MQSDSKVVAVIQDDGEGIDQEKISNGLGIMGIRERVGLHNGSFVLETAPGKGCRIRIEIETGANEICPN
jgi:two-component system sensor histidine kinase DegS